MIGQFNIETMISKSYSSRLIAKKVAGQLYDLTGDYYSVANTGGQFTVLPKEPAMPIIVKKPAKIEVVAELLPEGHPEVSCDELAMYEAAATPKMVGDFITVTMPYLKETDIDMVGTDATGTRRRFNKLLDCPVRDGDTIRASLTPARAKQKGLLEVA